MRLKSFTAPTMAEAMELVRNELGDDAIIVSTQRAAGNKGVRITAALESADADMAVAQALGESVGSAVIDAVKNALEAHNLPTTLLERLLHAARLSEQLDPLLACTAALEQTFSFANLPDRSGVRPFILIGKIFGRGKAGGPVGFKTTTGRGYHLRQHSGRGRGTIGRLYPHFAN
jgi:flagellar biosynthesis protein FlhF